MVNPELWRRFERELVGPPFQAYEEAHRSQHGYSINHLSFLVDAPVALGAARVVLVVALLLVPVGVSAAEDDPGIDVIDVSGPLDASALEFIKSSIEDAAETGQVLAVLQIDSPAVLDSAALEALVADLIDIQRPWRHDSTKLAAALITLLSQAQAQAPEPGRPLQVPIT